MFARGDVVTWEAHAGTKTYKKTGVIMAVIPPGVLEQSLPTGYTLPSRVRYGECCTFRSTQSYLVSVDNSCVLSWPIASKLKRRDEREIAKSKKEKMVPISKVEPDEYWSMIVTFHDGATDVYQSPRRLGYMKIGDSYKLVVQDPNGATIGEIGECQLRYVASITLMQPKRWAGWGLHVHHVKNGGYDAGHELKTGGLGESSNIRQDVPVHEEAGGVVSEPASVQ